MIKCKIIGLVLLSSLAVGCNLTEQQLIINRSPDVPATISVSSPAFANGKPIPERYTTSLDISPPLKWSSGPAGTKSYVLLVEDADAPPSEPFVQWVVYNIPSDVTTLPEGVPHDKKLKDNPAIIQGKNSHKQIGYLHPVPFDRHTHHYHFEVYALDDEFDPASGMSKSEVVTAMNEHVLAKGELVGTYRQK